MPHRGPRRPFNERQNQIADLVLDGLSYKEIGDTLRPRLKAGTVRKEVERMAWVFDYFHEMNGRSDPLLCVLRYAQHRATYGLLMRASPSFLIAAREAAAAGPAMPGPEAISAPPPIPTEPTHVERPKSDRDAA